MKKTLLIVGGIFLAILLLGSIWYYTDSGKKLIHSVVNPDGAPRVPGIINTGSDTSSGAKMVASTGILMLTGVSAEADTSFRNAYNNVYNTPLTEDTKASKLESLATARTILYNEEVHPDIRAAAGELLVSVFFDYGMQLGEGVFGKTDFTEDDIFELGQYATNIGRSRKTPLLVSYIALRFYPDQIDVKTVQNAITNYNRLTEIYGDENPCNNVSKIGSILYLSSKNGMDLGEEYKDFNYYFTDALTRCPEHKKSVVAFMWLAALSDSPENEINNLKVQELLTFIESKKSPTDRLVLNLKQSYFAPMKEPDTESIVDRLTQKYPEFQAYLNSVQAL